MARPGLGQKASASGDNGHLRAQKRTRWPEIDVSEIGSTRGPGSHGDPRAGAPMKEETRSLLAQAGAQSELQLGLAGFR